MIEKLRYFVSAILLLFLLFVLFGEPFAPFREKFRPRPEVIYESLRFYEEGESPFYQPVATASFTEINTFRDIVAWNNYGRDIPFLIVNDTILIAGYIEDEESGDRVRTTVDLFSVDMDTGQVYWQAKAGSNRLATNREYVFVEAEPEEGLAPASVIARDLISGEVIWQTGFGFFRFPVGVGYLTVKHPDLIVRTFNRGNEAYYLLDLETGELKERFNSYPLVEKPTYSGLIFSKQGYRVVGPIVVTRESDNSVAWTYNQRVVSNIAVGGPITYFFTEATELVAVDTMTGDVLGVLSFTPDFPGNFSFENNHIIVAADENIVSVYFRDSRQLSIFRFEHSVQQGS